MTKGYAQGRTPNDTRGLVVLPDGSTWDPGWVQAPDGTEAAVEERKYDADLQRQLRDEKSERANAGNSPTYDELTRELNEQRDFLRNLISPYRSASGSSKETRQLLYGRAVTLNAGQPTQGIYTPEQEKPEVWTIYIQPLVEADGITPFSSPYGHADLSSIIATVQWAIGGLTLSRKVVVQTCTVTRFQVVARKVMIDLLAVHVGDPTLGGKTFTVNLAAACGQENEIFGTAPLWIPSGSLPLGYGGSGPSQILLNAQNSAVPFTSGSLMSAVVTGQAIAAGPLYPMFFNQPQAPVGGDIPFLVLPPLFATGGTSTAEDEFVTSWDFDNGLAFGVSSTPDIFTMAPGGTLVRLDFKVGT